MRTVVCILLAIVLSGSTAQAQKDSSEVSKGFSIWDSLRMPSYSAHTVTSIGTLGSLVSASAFFKAGVGAQMRITGLWSFEAYYMAERLSPWHKEEGTHVGDIFGGVVRYHLHPYGGIYFGGGYSRSYLQSFGRASFTLTGGQTYERYGGFLHNSHNIDLMPIGLMLYGNKRRFYLSIEGGPRISIHDSESVYLNADEQSQIEAGSVVSIPRNFTFGRWHGVTSFIHWRMGFVIDR